jgi:phytoene dehydrogenase-like protein
MRWVRNQRENDFMSKTPLDVIVIGAGHNGLGCAPYFCRAGRKVIVLEDRPIVGGFAATEETIAAAPGFKFNDAPTRRDPSIGATF